MAFVASLRIGKCASSTRVPRVRTLIPTRSRCRSHVVSTRQGCRPRMSSPGADNSASAENYTLTVEAPSRTYPIIFSENSIANCDYYARLVRGDKAMVISNTKVGPLYMSRVVDALRRVGKTVFTLELDDGEEYKSLDSLSLILDACMEHQLDRRSTLLALGGGVVGDVVGFASAVFVRGVPFIQLPTTLLAVVDSAVGGKTAVNHPRGKNMIGAFYQPEAVLVDSTVLNTLDQRQYASGVAEVIKYGLICDPEFFSWCEHNMDSLMQRDPAALQYAMRRSCENKAAVVKADEREGGLRAILNLGHTFGHAIEAGMGYGEWLHGEAVAAGMVMALEMSYRLGWIDADLTRRTEHLLAVATLPVRPPPMMTLQRFMTFMAVDKKVESGKLKLVLLRGLGDAVVTSEFDKEVLYDTIMHFHKLYKRDPGQYDNQLGVLANSRR